MAKRTEIEIFGLSFLDLISCALGGTIVLMIILSTLVVPDGSTTPAATVGQTEKTVLDEMNSNSNTYFVLQLAIFGYYDSNTTKRISQRKLKQLYNNSNINPQITDYQAPGFVNVTKHICTHIEENSIEPRYVFEINNLQPGIDTLCQIILISNSLDTLYLRSNAIKDTLRIEVEKINSVYILNTL